MITSKSLKEVILKGATPQHGGTYTYCELRNLQQRRHDRWHGVYPEWTGRGPCRNTATIGVRNMKNLWDDATAQAFADDPLQLRVYTSRLLGQEPALVIMHGGGNKRGI